jgi:hypothetical protein
LTPYDEIADGLVDSQIESIRREDDTLTFRVRPPEVRGRWQAMVVAAVAADEDDSIAYCANEMLTDEGMHPSKALLTMHTRGAFETADESDLPALLGGPVVVHRPGGRLAVELHRVVAHEPTTADLATTWEPQLIGEGRYVAWRDADGRLIHAAGYCTRCAWSIAVYGADYAHLQPRRTIA